ncbi:hypothetical protein BaRGS_00005620 [Batillaria attramentaria]|uniref:Nuclease HARBI1 n=1 Tax=Batillaria attramentaria TaxID=370345 RepID=A0ABD0LTT6_9CAEN
MAAAVYMQFLARRNFRRNRVFRDRRNPMDEFTDDKLYKKFRFNRRDILELTDSVADSIEYLAERIGSLTPVLQVLLTLRFYATGTFQSAVGDIIGVIPTVSQLTCK